LALSAEEIGEGGGRDGAAGDAGASELEAQLAEAAELAAVLEVGDQRKQRAGDAGERGALFVKTRAICGAELRPGDGANEAGGGEAGRGEDIFDEDADGTFELVERVVEGDDAARDEVGEESVEVGFGAGVRVVAVYPEEADGAVPSGSDGGGCRPVDFDVRGDGGDVALEVVEGGASLLEQNGRVVRVDCDDFARAVVGGDGGEHGGGAALEAADLDDGAGGGDERGEGAEEARFGFGEEARDGRGSAPCGVECAVEIGGQGEGQARLRRRDDSLSDEARG